MIEGKIKQDVRDELGWGIEDLALIDPDHPYIDLLRRALDFIHEQADHCRNLARGLAESDRMARKLALELRIIRESAPTSPMTLEFYRSMLDGEFRRKYQAVPEPPQPREMGCETDSIVDEYDNSHNNDHDSLGSKILVAYDY